MDSISEILATVVTIIASAGGFRALAWAFKVQRKEAAGIHAFRLLQTRRSEIAEQIVASRDLLEDLVRALPQDRQFPAQMDETSIRKHVHELENEFVALSADIENKQADQEEENSDPKVSRRSKRARWTVIIALFLPVLVDIAILVIAVPVALRTVGGWALPSAIGVIFPAVSGSGWAALVVSFFVPHMTATAVLGWWAWGVRHLDSEKYAKATETARSVAGGYVALVALVVFVYLVGLGNVGWYDRFSDSLRELTKPMLPLLSVAAFVATFGPGYSKYMEGMAELERPTAANADGRGPGAVS